MNKGLPAQSGQSLFEVVVSLAISALVIVALVSLVSNSIRNANFSKNKSLASTYAQEASEWLRGERDSDPDLFFSVRAVAGLNYCINNLNWNSLGNCGSGSTISGTIFTRTLSFPACSYCDNTLIEANIKVFWTDSQGIHQVENVTNLSDWRER